MRLSSTWSTSMPWAAHLGHVIIAVIIHHVRVGAGNAAERIKRADVVFEGETSTECQHGEDYCGPPKKPLPTRRFRRHGGNGLLSRLAHGGAFSRVISHSVEAISQPNRIEWLWPDSAPLTKGRVMAEWQVAPTIGHVWQCCRRHHLLNRLRGDQPVSAKTLEAPKTVAHKQLLQWVEKMAALQAGPSLLV